MADLLFTCPACAKRLAIPEVGIGKTFPCTDCHQPVIAPEPSLYFECPACGDSLCAPSSLEGSWFQCPNCQAEIEIPTVARP